jgi:hypothetical protein
MNKRALLVIGAIVALLALGGSVAFARMMTPAPSNLDLSTQLLSRADVSIMSVPLGVNEWRRQPRAWLQRVPVAASR